MQHMVCCCAQDFKLTATRQSCKSETVKAGTKKIQSISLHIKTLSLSELETAHTCTHKYTHITHVCPAAPHSAQCCLCCSSRGGRSTWTSCSPPQDRHLEWPQRWPSGTCTSGCVCVCALREHIYLHEEACVQCGIQPLHKKPLLAIMSNFMRSQS